MKKLLFIGIVALMVQSLGAVTLPSTSYSPYAGGSASTGTEQSLLTSGTMVTGSYSVLGADSNVDVHMCDAEGPDPASCTTCCNDTFLPACLEDGGDLSACLSMVTTCTNSCIQGGSLPLDGGLSILLILSLAGGAAKLLRNKRS